MARRIAAKHGKDFLIAALVFTLCIYHWLGIRLATAVFTLPHIYVLPAHVGVTDPGQSSRSEDSFRQAFMVWS